MESHWSGMDLVLLVPAHPQQGSLSTRELIQLPVCWEQARGLGGKSVIIALVMVGLYGSAQGLWAPWDDK